MNKINTLPNYINFRLLTCTALISLLFASENLLGQNFTTIGNGTTSNTTTSYPSPYGNYYWGARHQFLITASELSSAGVPAGATINSIGFNVLSDNDVTHTNWQLVVFNAGTNSDPISAGFYSNGQISSSTITNSNPSAGWNQFGNSNLF